MSVATAAPAGAVEPHAANPYAGAKQYVNPTWGAQVEQAASRGGALAANMRVVGRQPTAVWMDRISAIAGNTDGRGLRYHLDQALLQKSGATPLVLNLVIYDLPGRDCYALASNGELPATAAGLARYRTEYIDPIASLLAEPKYQGLRISAIIEPDSLPNLVTNSSVAACQQAAPYYRQGVAYALDTLHAIPNVYTYVDIAHAGWLGWSNNAGPAAQLFAEVARSTKAGFASIDGFVSNTANSTPLVEPWLTDPAKSIGGQQVQSAPFYSYNPDFDETDFTAHMHRELIAAGFPASIGMLIDTSRNGWGGAASPSAVSASTDLATYVDESRVDRRTHRGAWCNPLGAGIGERPRATPAGFPDSHLDAFIWVKPPGESDGASTDIPNNEGKRADPNCDPTFRSPQLQGNLTGATPGAPLSGKWFEAQFKTLVQNAYPALGGTGTGPDTTAPSAPTGLLASTTTTTTVGLRWNAATDNNGGSGVAGYQVFRGSTRVTTVTDRTYTVTGLTPAAAYSFTVRAVDGAGNVSPPSAAVSVTTKPGSSGSGACAVKYAANSWSTGFTATVTITNTGTSAINGWTLGFRFGNGQTVTQGWSATWSQSGAAVTATNLSYNGSLAAGASTEVGFNGASSGTNSSPVAFTLNGASCAVS